MVARDLQNIVTSSSDESDNNPALLSLRSKKPMPPSREDAKRSWGKFSKDKEFGEEFDHAKKIKVSSDMGKHTHRWFPDENDNDAKPPVGYFDKLKKEKQEQDRDKEKEDLFLSVSDDDDSASDGSTNCGFTSDSSDEDGDEETRPKPTPHARHLTKESSVRCVASTTSDHTVHALSAPRVLKLPSATSTDQSTSSKSPSTKPDQTHSQLAITQLCREFDTARTKSQWDQAESAVSQLMALAPWSDDSTILIAKVAFRVKPHPELDQGFEVSLREAVAEHISWRYERLRETRNSIVAMLFRDHEDLAEIVYDRRLKALREKRADIIEIDSD
ncbi:hypothetical protein SLS58_001199 [Diplodia intermedia]|uniref:Uncharacterized protein n=1 Tax=Diplodia intermedia TaxID=856260 RepID=A0ABR3U3M8_9PEZI